MYIFVIHLNFVQLHLKFNTKYIKNLRQFAEEARLGE